MYRKRLIGFGIIVSLLTLLLALRLYYLQVFKSSFYADLAMRQRSSEISTITKRGTIYDRNLVPLTNNNSIKVLVAHKNLLLGEEDLYEDVLKNTSLSKKELDSLLASNNYILQIPVEKEFKVAYSNVYFVDVEIGRAHV